MSKDIFLAEMQMNGMLPQCSSGAESHGDHLRIVAWSCAWNSVLPCPQ